MTGPEHYRAAERLLDGHPMDQQAAQVHAMLALVAAAREIGDQLDMIRRPQLPEEDDSPCASGCKPSEGHVCGGPRCS